MKENIFTFGATMSKASNKKGILELFVPSVDSSVVLPVAGEAVRAGFPSPAEDFVEVSIDLNQELIKNQATTFYCRVIGDSMQEIGISDGDLLVVDKSLEPQDGKIAVCFVDGEFTLKTIKIEKDYCLLMPANKNYKPIKITEENDFIVWGVVTYSIKTY